MSEFYPGGGKVVKATPGCFSVFVSYQGTLMYVINIFPYFLIVYNNLDNFVYAYDQC